MLNARRAISLVFFVNGFVLANWIARIPAIKHGLGINNGQMGTVLLGMALGALIAFPFAGRLIGDIGSARATTGFALALTVVLPLLSWAPSAVLLFAALVLFGAGNGGMDVSMNAQGVEVEHAWGRPILNSMHGFYSLGGFAGAGTGSLAAALGLAPHLHFAIVSVLGAAGLLRAHTALIPDHPVEGDHEPAPVFALPPRVLVPLGVVAACAAIGEGSMADWGALYLRNHLDTSAGIAALGFAAFSLAMLIARFAGDSLVARFGPDRIVRIGGLIAAAGLALGLLADRPSTALLGFAAIGLGLASVYPLVFGAAGNRRDIPRGRAVASVATMGYSGFLLGPPLLGWVAQLTSLRAALGIVVLLAFVIAMLAPAARRPSRSTATQPAETAGVRA